jgi:hypothetical protein
MPNVTGVHEIEHPVAITIVRGRGRGPIALHDSSTFLIL